jgi:AcrR family transcriptional regulator
MPAEIQQKRSGEVTRQRILTAAIARFAQASYEEVKLRHIAMDVGVDVALVHRSFGSKEQLFAAVLSAASPYDRLLASDWSELSTVFANDMFAAKQDDALQIALRSLTSPQARDVLRAHGAMDFIGPIAAKLDGPARQQRAALFAACLIGIGILRDVLRLEPLLDESRKAAQPLIERILGACLGDDREAGPSTAKAASVKAKTRKPRAASSPGTRQRAGVGTVRGRHPASSDIAGAD